MKKLWFTALVVCMGVAALGFGQPAAEAAKKGTDLTVATFNIDAKAHPNLDAQRNLLAKLGVDIAGLQEVDRNTQRNPLDMPQKFNEKPFAATYFAKAIDFEGGEYGICIVSRHKMYVKNTRALDSTGAEEQRVYERVVIEKNGKRIAFYNTHLSWETVEIRNKQLIELKAALDSDSVPYKIVVGDLNVDQNHKELNMFKDTYNMANGKDGAWYDTFNGEDPAMRVMSVDNIITSKNIEIVKVGMVEAGLSDHNLLYANLKLMD